MHMKNQVFIDENPLEKMTIEYKTKIYRHIRIQQGLYRYLDQKTTVLFNQYLCMTMWPAVFI